MDSSVRNDPKTAPSKTDVEALYDELFGPPALDAVEQKAEERDELDAYAAVYEMAQQFPAVTRKAARDGRAARYQGADPFDYSVRETRERGEVTP